MKRFNLRKRVHSYRGRRKVIADMALDAKGEYCLYSEAMAEIGDLRKRLERANASRDTDRYGHPIGGYDERKFN